MPRSEYRVIRPRRWRAAVWSVSLIALLLASIVGASKGTSAHPGAVPARTAPQDPQTDAFYQVCSDGHEGDRISEVKRTRAGWEG